MIPLSVRMKGWMRYREEEVADFGGASLIAIIGENGAGKSSIFDAITFALYGVHRLGKMHAAELISQDMDRLSVEFEFEAEGQRYLVRRSRGHKESERDQSLWIWDGGANDWTQVPGTEKEDALRRSLDAVVRLSADAFTSSFMLQQGGATEFLDADPKPRFDIISSLIGLKEYEVLEKRAREAGRAEKQRLDDLTEKLKAFEGVDESTVDALRAEVAEATARESAAADLLIAATALLADARRHAALVREIAALDARIAAAEMLIAERTEIEKQATLYETLSKAIETLNRVRSALLDASRARAAADGAAREAEAIDAGALARAFEAAEAAAKVAEAARTAAETSHTQARDAERAAHDFATSAGAIIDLRTRVGEFDARVAAQAAEIEGLSKAIAAAEKIGAAAKGELAAAEKAMETGRAAAAEARARVGTLKEQLDARKAAAKEATCSHCGQPIDKKTAKTQVERLTASLAEASAEATKAAAEEKAASKALVDARKRHEDAAAAITKQSQQLHGIESARAAIDAERGRAAAELKALEAAAGKRLAAIEKAKPEHAAAQKALAAAEGAWKAARADVEKARAGEERARKALDDGQRRRAALEAQAREQAATAAGFRQQAEAFTSGLGGLADDALADPDRVLEILRSQQTELAAAPARKVALDAAMRDHTAWSAQREVKQADVAAIPEGHRVTVEEAGDVAAQADADARTTKASLQDAQQRLTMLEARIEQIATMRDERDRADKRRKLLAKLVKLLGKQGLQGALVTDALGTIKNHANTFLQRLTGGTLQLTIQRGEGDALELQAIDSTCMREARSVKVLSGSQKFRCAVAIASGIGQYAGAGGMRSIVIDEGFASLDQAGQQLMVEELQQLATHMDKVIVVSHLETFTDPGNFPDRIMVETRGTGSHIRKLF